MTDAIQLLNDNEEAMRQVLDGRQVDIWTAIPGIIQSVNWNQMTCEVQPAIKAVIQDQNGNLTQEKLPLLINVPICFPSTAGFLITLPLAVNDEVLVIFSSRCHDAWWQSGGIQQAMEARMHDLSDGFVIPGPKSLPNTVSALSGAAISTTGAQIRNTAGTTYVEISGDGKIKLVSPSEIDVTGNLKVSGTIVAQGEITGNSIPLSTHIHPGVTSGGSDTGAPLP